MNIGILYYVVDNIVCFSKILSYIIMLAIEKYKNNVKHLLFSSMLV